MTTNLQAFDELIQAPEKIRTELAIFVPACISKDVLKSIVDPIDRLPYNPYTSDEIDQFPIPKIRFKGKTYPGSVIKKAIYGHYVQLAFTYQVSRLRRQAIREELPFTGSIARRWSKDTNTP